MNKVLVTGGLGTLGAFVCRALLSTSRQPAIYDIGSETRLIRDIAADCVIEQGDIGNLPRLMDTISRHKPQAIAHLAGQTGPQVEALAWSLLNANLIGAATVFEAARLSGIQRIAFASSRQVYGPVAEKHRHPLYEPVPETHPREPITLYGRLKRACEDVADHYARLYGLDIIALRLGSSYGSGKFGRHDKVSPLMGLIEAAFANRPFRIECGSEQCDDLCYHREAANGFIAALESAACPGTFRAYNIASGELISWREMITILEEIYPSWSGEAGPGLDYRRFGVGYYFRLAIDKAEAELGFKPRFDFRRAVIDYAERHEQLQPPPKKEQPWFSKSPS